MTRRVYPYIKRHDITLHGRHGIPHMYGCVTSLYMTPHGNPYT